MKILGFTFRREAGFMVLFHIGVISIGLTAGFILWLLGYFKNKIVGQPSSLPRVTIFGS